ncbi:dDENN domain protein [Ditylenchus destructor]|nr:dDENN domain protein [Ditylenchus destructor]
MNRSVRLWQHVVDNLQTNNLFVILKYLINEHREKKETAVGLKTHFSIYRDILFVALEQFNRSVDREQFDRQYYQELKHLPPRILPLLSSEDLAPKPLIVACRRIFMPLDLR